MAHPLIELSRTRNVTNCYLVTENYLKHPALCRFGVWIGWKCEFAETVVLSYEHDPEELYVGWSINGTTVIDPGYSSGTPPWGAPAPGAPSVTYRCPVGGLFHRLSLTSTPGADQTCLWVQVLYRHPQDAGAPFHYGPATSVCVKGWGVTWPGKKLKETQDCLARFYELLHKYVEVAHVGPGDPVERWLEQLEGDDAMRVKALVETLEELAANAEPELAEAIKAELTAMVHWARGPGAAGLAPPPAGDGRTE
jgi:hypothetical protein